MKYKNVYKKVYVYDYVTKVMYGVIYGYKWCDMNLFLFCNVSLNILHLIK